MVVPTRLPSLSLNGNSKKRWRSGRGVVCSVALWLAGASAPAVAASVLHYTARLRGIAFFDVTYCLALDSGRYQAVINARTLGLAEMLVHGRVAGRAVGSIAGDAVKPDGYAEYGRISGDSYNLSLDYPSGDPVVRSVSPPPDTYRQVVPPSALAGAIDGMSAIVLETLVVTRTGACQGAALVFDGRQLRRLTTQTGGHDTLERSARLDFSGSALRCDTASVMLAGFLKNKAVGPQASPRFSKAWLAPVLPGGPALPVRFAFDADLLGDIIVDLDHATADPGVACAWTPAGAK